MKNKTDTRYKMQDTSKTKTIQNAGYRIPIKAISLLTSYILHLTSIFLTRILHPASCIPLLSLLLLTFSHLYSKDVYLQLIAHGQRVDIGISEFVPRRATVEESKTARKIRDIINNDLLFTRMFNIVEGGPVYTGKPEELQYWQKLNADILLSGLVLIEGKTIRASTRLLDLEGGREIWSMEFSEDSKNLRRLAHRISDEIVLRLTGERGIASTKIVFVNDTTGSKELYLIDYDGYNLERITNENSVVLLPKFSPDGKEIIFTTYRYGNPDLYSIDLKTRTLREVSGIQGLNTAAVFSPDGKKIALTLSRGEEPNLFLIDLKGAILRRLTYHKGVDTSPSFSPTGNEIVFISNRPGYPQLYIMNLDGTNLRRIPTKDFCDSPAWSPRGDKIAFSMLSGGNYNIFLYDVRTEKISQLTFDSGNNENPAWSPDGRCLTFISTRNGKKELFRMFLDGSGQTRVAEIPGRSFTPHWSPRLY